MCSAFRLSEHVPELRFSSRNTAHRTRSEGHGTRQPAVTSEVGNRLSERSAGGNSPWGFPTVLVSAPNPRSSLVLIAANLGQGSKG